LPGWFFTLSDYVSKTTNRLTFPPTWFPFLFRKFFQFSKLPLKFPVVFVSGGGWEGLSPANDISIVASSV